MPTILMLSGKSKVLVFFRVCSFNMHAPYMLSPADLGDFSGVLQEHPPVLGADDFLGACYRKAMTPEKLWTLLFSPFSRMRGARARVSLDWCLIVPLQRFCKCLHSAFSLRSLLGIQFQTQPDTDNLTVVGPGNTLCKLLGLASIVMCYSLCACVCVCACLVCLAPALHPLQ